MADPIQQVFMQAAAPTGKSNTGFEAFVQGRQLAQRDRQIGLQEREQDALLQLRAQGEALQNQSTGLDIQLKLLAKQRELDVKAGQAELLQLMLSSKDNPDGIIGTGEGAVAIINKYGAAVMASGIGQAWFNNWRGAWAIKQGVSQMGQVPTKIGEAPLYEVTIDEQTGQPVPRYRRETDREFAKPEIGRLVQLRDEAKASGNVSDAELYETAIANSLGRYNLTARSRAHTELATTIRQQMRSIDDDTRLKPAERDAQKAVLMKQLEDSRRGLLGELESEAPLAPAERATRDAITRIDKEIADLEVDLAKRPGRQGLDRLDLVGQENRTARLAELKAQRQRLTESTAPRPPGLTDAQILKEAAEAVAQGKDRAWIKRQLDRWGVKGDF